MLGISKKKKKKKIRLTFWVKTGISREFPGSPVIKTYIFTAEGPGSIPGWGTEILQAPWCG